eukprot:7885979-Pyramimonas_sp.AAC.1
MRRVLVLHIQHLFVYLLGGRATAEQSRRGQVAAMARASCAHRILGVADQLARRAGMQCW